MDNQNSKVVPLNPEENSFEIIDTAEIKVETSILCEKTQKRLDVLRIRTERAAARVRRITLNQVKAV